MLPSCHERLRDSGRSSVSRRTTFAPRRRTAAATWPAFGSRAEPTIAMVFVAGMTCASPLARGVRADLLDPGLLRRAHRLVGADLLDAGLAGDRLVGADLLDAVPAGDGLVGANLLDALAAGDGL